MTERTANIVGISLTSTAITLCTIAFVLQATEGRFERALTSLTLAVANVFCLAFWIRRVRRGPNA